MLEGSRPHAAALGRRSREPDLLPPRLAPPAPVYSTQPRAEPGPGAAARFGTAHSRPSLTSPPHYGHVQPLTSHRCGAQNLRLHLPERCFSIQLWWLWLTVPGQRGSGVPPQQAGGGRSSRQDRGTVTPSRSNAGRAEHPWLKSRMRTGHCKVPLWALCRAFRWQGKQLPTLSATCGWFYLPHISQQVFEVVGHSLPCPPSSRHQQPWQDSTGPSTAGAPVVWTVPLPHPTPLGGEVCWGWQGGNRVSTGGTGNPGAGH